MYDLWHLDHLSLRSDAWHFLLLLLCWKLVCHVQGCFFVAVRRQTDIKVDLIEVSIRRTEVPDINLGSRFFRLDDFCAWPDFNLSRLFVDITRQLRLRTRRALRQVKEIDELMTTPIATTNFSGFPRE